MKASLDGVTVNRLRIRCRSADSSVARVRAERWLNIEALQPEWLSPSAIVCIRRLVDPAPGQLSFETRRPTPSRWAEAVATTISRRAREAAWPMRGDVAADAETVIFADRAELLASLAFDWCAGVVTRRWWWPALVGVSTDAAAIVGAWLASPHYIAAALEQMANARAAAPFVRRLQKQNALALLRSIIVAHDLRALAGAVDRLALPASAQPNRQLKTYRRSSEVASPWSGSVPECQAPWLRPDQQCLLGIALTLRRQPARVRTDAFVDAVERWTVDAVRSGPHSSRSSVATACDVAPTEASRLVRTAVTRSPGTGANTSRSAALAPEVVRSDVGGVFYLLNAAIALGWYGDFTAPGQIRSDLPIWDFVRVVGRCLTRRRFRCDAVWQLLEHLAGHSRVPSRPARPLIGSLVREVRLRIASAFGIGQPREADSLLCVHAARIVTSPAHLDVFFSLDAHPIAIRLAGLDRNPGWIPAADRIVTFHYE
jgi:hypothetical protein